MGLFSNGQPRSSITEGDQMEQFTPIDRSRWARESQYRLFTEQWTTICYSVTVRLDVTDTVRYCKEHNVKFVPALLWLTTRAMTQQENFRMAVRGDVLGVWDVIHPIYPVVNADDNITFHTTAYTPHFSDFLAAYLAEAERNSGAVGAFAEMAPENGYIISIAPYIEFESMSFHLRNARNYYAPVFEIGRYHSEDDRLILPMSITVNHAVIDLKHVNQLKTTLQQDLSHPETWC